MLFARRMSSQFSAYVRDKHIAPGVSQFTSADITDMSTHFKESPHWIANFFLNSVFSATYKPPMHAYTYNFLRRAQYAFSEHNSARESTLSFITSGGQSVKRYADALFHWECFLGQSWHAYALLVAAFQGRALEKGDGSVEQRLNALYNQMKHVESRIENGQMLTGATVPVWLDNAGLRSIDTTLTFRETAEVLKDLGKYADALANPMIAREILGNSHPE